MWEVTCTSCKRVSVGEHGELKVCPKCGSPLEDGSLRELISKERAPISERLHHLLEAVLMLVSAGALALVLKIWVPNFLGAHFVEYAHIHKMYRFVEPWITLMLVISAVAMAAYHLFVAVVGAREIAFSHDAPIYCRPAQDFLIHPDSCAPSQKLWKSEIVKLFLNSLTPLAGEHAVRLNADADDYVLTNRRIFHRQAEGFVSSKPPASVLLDNARDVKETTIGFTSITMDLESANGEVSRVTLLSDEGVLDDITRVINERPVESQISICDEEVAQEDRERLFSSIRVGNVPALREVLRHTSPRVRDQSGSSPLVAAFVAYDAGSVGSTDVLEAIVELLLESGAEVSAANSSGMTPLHCAAHVGARRAVSLLLSRMMSLETNMTAKTSYGKTPLDLAVSGGHDGVIDDLMKAAGFTDMTQSE